MFNHCTSPRYGPSGSSPVSIANSVRPFRGAPCWEAPWAVEGRQAWFSRDVSQGAALHDAS